MCYHFQGYRIKIFKIHVAYSHKMRDAFDLILFSREINKVQCFHLYNKKYKWNVRILSK